MKGMSGGATGGVTGASSGGTMIPGANSETHTLNVINNKRNFNLKVNGSQVDPFLPFLPPGPQAGAAAPTTTTTTPPVQ